MVPEDIGGDWWHVRRALKRLNPGPGQRSHDGNYHWDQQVRVHHAIGHWEPLHKTRTTIDWNFDLGSPNINLHLTERQRWHCPHHRQCDTRRGCKQGRQHARTFLIAQAHLRLLHCIQTIIISVWKGCILSWAMGHCYHNQRI